MVTRCRRFTDKQGVYLTRELDASLQKFLQRDTRHTHARRWRRLLLLLRCSCGRTRLRATGLFAALIGRRVAAWSAHYGMEYAIL